MVRPCLNSSGSNLTNYKSGDSKKDGPMSVLVGLTFSLLTVAVCAVEWGAISKELTWAIDVLTIFAIALITPTATWGRKVYVLVGLSLTAALIAFDPEWQAALQKCLSTTSYIAAFFCALAALGVPARSSPAILDCGRYLAEQPPGRRYFALSVGGQIFSLILSYGSLILLGNMAVANASKETDDYVRTVRVKRMLLAIERALISTLPWSPTSYTVTISVLLIPGASWADALLPGIVSGMIFFGVGWGLDTILKPAPSPSSTGKRERKPGYGSWRSLQPMLILLVILSATLFSLNSLTGIRIPGIIVVIVPVLAFVWLCIMMPFKSAMGRVWEFVRKDVPAMHSELLLLMMAGYIGSVGGRVISPLFESWGVTLSGVPTYVILVSLIWVVALIGQLGLHSILTVSLIIPLLPSAVEMGVTPTTILIAATAGWSLSGICSPFTATAILIGNYSGNTARHVAWVWNGFYAFVVAVVLSLWVVLYGMMANA